MTTEDKIARLAERAEALYTRRSDVPWYKADAAKLYRRAYRAERLLREAQLRREGAWPVPIVPGEPTPWTDPDDIEAQAAALVSEVGDE